MLKVVGSGDGGLYRRLLRKHLGVKRDGVRIEFGHRRRLGVEDAVVAPSDEHCAVPSARELTDMPRDVADGVADMRVGGLVGSEPCTSRT